MAEPRAPQAWSRLFDRTPAATYLVDEQGHLVGYNRAARAELGPLLESLWHTVLRYGAVAGAEPAQHLAAALAVPPDLAPGGSLSAAVAWRNEEGRWQAAAHFLELGDGQTRGATLVRLGPRQPAAAAWESGAPDDAAPGELHQALLALRAEFGELFQVQRLAGQCPATVRLRQQVLAAAQCRANVLIVGPPGSGRQHAARAIYLAADPRQLHPYMPMAGDLMDADLLRSTLAAWSSGAPAAGANQTLVLLEADRLSAQCQAELWSWLQRGPRSVRLLATAGTSLVELAQQGRYHAPLAHWLACWVLEAWPLAQRLDDLPYLAQALLEQQNARSTKQLAGFVPEALAQMALYRWPGNFDELSQVVAEAHTRAEGPLVTWADLPEPVRAAGPGGSGGRAKRAAIDLEKVLAEIELDLLRQALDEARGNKTLAARLLGLSRPRFYRRLVHFGLAAATEIDDEAPVFEPAPEIDDA